MKEKNQVWQDAIEHALYVYGDEKASSGKEVVEFILAVVSMLEEENQKQINMKPKDIIRHTNVFDKERFWEISAIFLGDENQESNVELKPLNEYPNNNERPICCPLSILEAAIRSGEVRHYYWQ
jgi:hypothetical protein